MIDIANFKVGQRGLFQLLLWRRSQTSTVVEICSGGNFSPSYGAACNIEETMKPNAKAKIFRTLMDHTQKEKIFHTTKTVINEACTVADQTSNMTFELPYHTVALTGEARSKRHHSTVTTSLVKQ